MYVKAYLDLSLRSLVFSLLLLPGPCTWKPGREVPGCRGGLFPFCCRFVFVCFLTDLCRNGPIRCSRSHLHNGLRPKLNGPVQHHSLFLH